MLSRGRSARALVIAGTTAAFVVPSAAAARPADTPVMPSSSGAAQAAVPNLGSLDSTTSSDSGLSDTAVIVVSGAALLAGSAVGFGAGRTSRRRMLGRHAGAQQV